MLTCGLPLALSLTVWQRAKFQWFRMSDSNGAFTPEQDNDKTTTRQMLNLCISIMPFTPGPTNPAGVKGIIGMHRFNICLVVVLSLSCRCLALVWKHHNFGSGGSMKGGGVGGLKKPSEVFFLLLVSIYDNSHGLQSSPVRGNFDKWKKELDPKLF